MDERVSKIIFQNIIRKSSTEEGSNVNLKEVILKPYSRPGAENSPFYKPLAFARPFWQVLRPTSLRGFKIYSGFAGLLLQTSYLGNRSIESVLFLQHTFVWKQLLQGSASNLPQQRFVFVLKAIFWKVPFKRAFHLLLSQPSLLKVLLADLLFWKPSIESIPFWKMLYGLRFKTTSPRFTLEPSSAEVCGFWRSLCMTLYLLLFKPIISSIFWCKASCFTNKSIASILFVLNCCLAFVWEQRFQGSS